MFDWNRRRSGNLTGLDLPHRRCRVGTGTVSWACLAVPVVGIHFSTFLTTIHRFAVVASVRIPSALTQWPDDKPVQCRYPQLQAASCESTPRLLRTPRFIPGPVITDHLSREASKAHYAEGTSFHIGMIEMVGNTGTYIDAPFHRYADGKDLAELTLEQVADLAGLVFRADRSRRAIGPELFGEADVRGKAVLVHTGWSEHWRTETYFHGHPFLTAEAAMWLEQAGAALVGIDSMNIDDTSGGERPVHSILLRAGILIVEHLCNLDQLPDSGFRFYAIPVKVRGFSSFPVRAFAIAGT